jgi:DNA-directed RNA polymerase alpha subunit
MKYKVEVKCLHCDRPMRIYVEVTPHSYPEDNDISRLPLSARAIHVLNNAGYYDTKEIEHLSMYKLKQIPGCGVRTAKEIYNVLNPFQEEKIEPLLPKIGVTDKIDWSV